MQEYTRAEVLLFLVSLLFLVFLLSMVLIDDNSTILQIGDALPAFGPLPNATKGEQEVSSESDADILVIIFTCNHCPYAQAYEQRIVDLANEFRNDSVQFLLINSNDAESYPEDSFPEMKRRAHDMHYPFPYLFDESQDVAKSFGALCTPHCFVFDHDRNLRYKGRVDDNWKDIHAVSERNLHSAITALIHHQSPPKSEANAIGCSIKWK